MNSNATRTRVSAIFIELVPSSHGRTAVPTPNMSANWPRIVCQ